jgi:hypothetical protein
MPFFGLTCVDTYALMAGIDCLREDGPLSQLLFYAVEIGLKPSQSDAHVGDIALNLVDYRI